MNKNYYEKPIRVCILYPNGKTRSINADYGFISKKGKIISKISKSTGKQLI